MLGPGTTITHAAVRTLAENGCTVFWTGEHGVRLYAQGLGKTRSAANLMRQARLWADPTQHMRVVLRLYRMRFAEPLPDSLTLEQVRGREGVRVRDAYARAAREIGLTWKGRNYRSGEWEAADPINRALSCANSCLYGICHAAIVAIGYSPALGFIHTGKSLSFVYDIADLYKTAVSVPVAFRAVAEGVVDLERRVRLTCRDAFRRARVLDRIVPDIHRALSDEAESGSGGGEAFDADAARPGGLWDPHLGEVPGGRLHDVPESSNRPAPEQRG